MISEVELKAIADKINPEIAEKVKAEFLSVEKNVSDKIEDLKKGSISQASFEEYKAEQMNKVNETLKTVEKLEEATTKQGIKINTLLEKAAPNSKTLVEFLAEKQEEIKALKSGKAGSGYMEITGAEMKAAGVQSIATTIPTASPYAPGIGGTVLEIFNIAQNPNFITNRVNLGRTDQSMLAWANEVGVQGGAGLVLEGQLKPQGQHTFSVAYSKYKKVAEWFELTDELVKDLPNFATNIQRLLRNDVIRAFDDLVQIDVQNAARPYQITGLNGKINFANYYDALNSLAAQVGVYNYNVNTMAYNLITNTIIEGEKNSNGTPIVPSFAGRIAAMTVFANKLANYYALVGDLQQFNVDIYEDFVLKIGWINDEFVSNKFAVLGEMKYHSYIPDVRRNAIAYDSLDTVQGLINKTA
jgi:hypothetical protein